jgi:hypothetical protein
MGGLFAKAKRFASSPQGKKAMRQASDYAKSPKAKKQIASLRERVTGGGKHKGGPAHGPGPGTGVDRKP